MLQTFRDFPLKYKLIACFLLIILINAVSGLFGLRFMKELGQLVNMTYDKALMAGTFAQASKIDFLQADYEFRSLILAENETDLARHLSKVNKAYETLQEDLTVVSERSLSLKSSSLINEIRTKLEILQKTRDEIVSQKKLSLQSKNKTSDSMDLVKNWDTNPDKKSLYRKISAMYDDAAVVGYQFRLDSETKSKQNLKFSLGFLIASILASLLLSIGVSFLIISPLQALEGVCKVVGLGDYKVRAQEKSKDEFGTLATSFNFMLHTIEDKTENISSLLSSLPFGLFYFDKDGTISKERSQSTDTIFNSFSSYQTLGDFFGAHECNTRQINDILSAVFQGLMPFNSAVQLFPRTIQVHKGNETRTIQLGFKPKYIQKKKLERVIVIAEDVTEKIRAQEESKSLTERVERISRVSSDLASFKEYLPAVMSLYNSLSNRLGNFDQDQATDLLRDLHSLKGLLGIYAFKTCAQEIHQIENLIAKSELIAANEILIKVRLSEALFNDQAQDITQLLALNVDSGLKYYNEHKINLIRAWAEKTGDQKLIANLHSLDKFPVEKVLAKYSNYAQSIAAKLEDKKVKIVFESSDEVSYEEVQRLDLVLVHVLNNSVDHGIESCHERIGLNKKEYGLIKISCKRNQDQSLDFKISDDGRGINGEFLLTKAIKLGLISEQDSQKITDQDKVNLIFASGLSSKETSSDVSGRGIGMDAVKTYLEGFGGTINLFTQVGVGTTFSFTVPAFET